MTLDSSSYLVAPKTDGVRFLLMLTISQIGDPLAVMISRDMSMYEVEIWAPDTFFENGCLIDGELAWGNSCVGCGQLIYFAFDCIMMNGKRTRDEKLIDRIDRLNKVLSLTNIQNDWVQEFSKSGDYSVLDFIPGEQKIVATPGNAHMLTIQTKTMQRMDFWASKHNGHGNDWTCHEGVACDGLIFTPIDLPVYVNTHRNLFKWKPADMITVDVMVNDGKIYAVNDNGEILQMDELCGRTIGVLSKEMDSGVFECTVKVTGVAIILSPMRKRNDKDSPNSINTLESTITGTINTIELDEILRWATAVGTRK